MANRTTLCFSTMQLFALFLLALSKKLNETSPMPSRIMATMQNENKPELVISSFFNYGGVVLPVGPMCTEGVKLALDALQKNTVLVNYNLVIDAHDDKCDPSKGMQMFTDALNSAQQTTENLVPLFVGPACAINKFTGQIGQHYDIVAINYGTIALDAFTNRRTFNAFYSIMPSFEIFYAAIPAFLKSNGWKRVFLLTEATLYWNPLEKVLQDSLAKENISLAGTSAVPVPGGFPLPQHFELAVRDMAAFDPRIIIINTNVGPTIACWLYRYHLYGHGYVFIIFGPSFFLTNSSLRPPNCSDEMLAKVLESAIFFTFASPTNLDENTADALGTTTKAFEAALKERITDPDLNDKWFYWRRYCYTEVAVAALALNATEGKLQQKRDTLSNWVTGGDNFRNNGSYIRSLLQESLNSVHFTGQDGKNELRFNSRVGMTGFFQMQRDYNIRIRSNLDLTASFKAVPVATYDTSAKNPVIVAGPGKYVWITSNGQAPYDSLRVVEVKDRILDSTAQGVLYAFAGILLVINCLLLAPNLRKIRSPIMSDSVPLLNLPILFGNVFLLSFLLILPTESNLLAHVQCVAASVAAVIGYSLLSTGFLSKLQVAVVAPRIEMQTNNKVAKRNSANPVRRTRRIQRRMRKVAFLSVMACLVITLFEILLLSLWYGVNPLVTRAIYETNIELSQNDQSVAYQHYIYACQLDMLRPTSVGFLIAMAASLALILLRSVYLALSLRHKPTMIDDAKLVGIALYAVTLIILAAAAVITGFYSQKPRHLEVAVSIVALLIVFVDTVLIFLPKLKFDLRSLS